MLQELWDASRPLNCNFPLVNSLLDIKISQRAQMWRWNSLCNLVCLMASTTNNHYAGWSIHFEWTRTESDRNSSMVHQNLKPWAAVEQTEPFEAGGDSVFIYWNNVVQLLWVVLVVVLSGRNWAFWSFQLINALLQIDSSGMLLRNKQLSTVGLNRAVLQL